MKDESRTRISLKDKDLVDAFWSAETTEQDRDKAENVLAFLLEQRAPKALTIYLIALVQRKRHFVAGDLSELAKKAGRSIAPWKEGPRSISEFVLFDPGTGEEFDSLHESHG